MKNKLQQLTSEHKGNAKRRMEYYSAIKKNEIMPFAAPWMGLEIIIMLREISHTEKGKYSMTSFTCGI